MNNENCNLSGFNTTRDALYRQDRTAYNKKLFTQLNDQSHKGIFTDLAVGGFRCHKFILWVASANGECINPAIAPHTEDDWLGLQRIQVAYPREMYVCLSYIYGREITLTRHDAAHLKEFSKRVFSPVLFEQFLQQFGQGISTHGLYKPWANYLKSQIENEITTSGYKHFSDLSFDIHGQRIRCHRFLLAAMCPAFEALYETRISEPDYKGKMNYRISLDGHSYPKLTFFGVNNVARFMYGLDLQVQDYGDSWSELEEAATFFELTCFKPIILDAWDFHTRTKQI